ncbi:hypothetical protein EON68_01840 [archaeon]|nr:MAG: hypothetical protein EON68_01840 [archaeon]
MRQACGRPAPAVPGGGAPIQRTSSLPRGSSLQRTPSGSLTQAGRTPAASSSSTAEPADGGAGAHATRITATRLGVAAFLSVLPPEHCLNTLHELDAALTEGLRLDTDDLHITYLLTPLSCVTMYDMSDNTWRSFASTLETLTPAEAALASRYNVSGSFVRDILTFGGSETSASMGPASYNARLDAHLRFFCAILLRELMSEVSILEVEMWSGLPRGRLQSLQLYTASHANSVVTLCRHLNWHEAALVFSDFVRRLEFGVRPELVPLLDVPHMTVPRARLLFNHKISGLEELVATPPDRVADILMVRAACTRKCVVRVVGERVPAHHGTAVSPHTCSPCVQKYVPFTKSADSSKSVTSSSAGALMSALTHLEQAQARQEQLGGNSTRMQTLFNMHLAVARDLIAGATELLNARVARTAA